VNSQIDFSPLLSLLNDAGKHTGLTPTEQAREEPKEQEHLKSSIFHVNYHISDSKPININPSVLFS